jgi:CheY-like chemotaxis protein
VADYHLDHGDNGIDVANGLRDKLNKEIPVIINSADQAESIREMAMEQLSFVTIVCKVMKNRRSGS